MPDKLPVRPRPARMILLMLALLLAGVCLIPQGRLGVRFVVLGMRHVYGGSPGR